MTSPQLSLRDVYKRFGASVAVSGVSFDVASGHVVVILGPSGCGKTTVLRLIAGLDVPDSGEVWCGGRQFASAGRSLIPSHERSIGFVFQDLALWPHLTVYKNLDFVLESARMPTHERPARIHEALALAHVDSLARRYPHQLSGGEQQRVALARALVGRPQLLLMDEPLSSLDAELRAALRGELLRLRSSFQVTTVYVTHDREDAGVLADQVIEMRAGEVVHSILTARTRATS